MFQLYYYFNVKQRLHGSCDGPCTTNTTDRNMPSDPSLGFPTLNEVTSVLRLRGNNPRYFLPQLSTLYLQLPFLFPSLVPFLSLSLTICNPSNWREITLLSPFNPKRSDRKSTSFSRFSRYYWSVVTRWDWGGRGEACGRPMTFGSQSSFQRKETYCLDVVLRTEVGRGEDPTHTPTYPPIPSGPNLYLKSSLPSRYLPGRFSSIQVWPTTFVEVSPLETVLRYRVPSGRQSYLKRDISK